MSLNQISLRDGEYSNTDGEKLMKKIDSIVEEKIYQVQSYKENLTGGVEKIKFKKITFNV